MGLFNEIGDPVFLKSGNSLELQLEQLRSYRSKLNSEGKKVLDRDIKFLEYGIIGEKAIEFELKNLHLPCYVIHDLRLTCEDSMSSQIDYLVFTKKICFIIECKNLFGDLRISEDGDFIRTMRFNGRMTQEGIYSPIVQSDRHLNLMRSIEVKNKTSALAKVLVNKFFNSSYKSIVVLSNPKTIIDLKDAPSNIRGRILRADQLNSFLINSYRMSDRPKLSDLDLLDWSERYLHLDEPSNIDYFRKYDRYLINEKAEDSINSDNISERILDSMLKNNNPIIGVKSLQDRLKEYRLSVSKKSLIKPYQVFTDKELNDLLTIKPSCIKDLESIKGFGSIKCSKYGMDIINIINDRA